MWEYQDGNTAREARRTDNALVDTFSSYLGTHIQDINRRLTLGKVSPEELEWMSNKTVDMFLTSEEEFSTMSGNALVVKAAGKLMDDEYLKDCC